MDLDKSRYDNSPFGLAPFLRIIGIRGRNSVTEINLRLILIHSSKANPDYRLRRALRINTNFGVFKNFKYKDRR